MKQLDNATGYSRSLIYRLSRLKINWRDSMGLPAVRDDPKQGNIP